MSLSLNSYLIFHPKGPNFLLSWIIAWKNVKPHISLLKTSFLTQESNSSYDMLPHDLFKLALIPLGGSVVSLIPFYNT